MVLASAWFEGGELTVSPIVDLRCPNRAAKSRSTDRTEADRLQSVLDSRLSWARVKKCYAVPLNPFPFPRTMYIDTSCEHRSPGRAYTYSLHRIHSHKSMGGYALGLSRQQGLSVGVPDKIDHHLQGGTERQPFSTRTS